MKETEAERARVVLLHRIAADMSETASWTGRDRLSPAVISALRHVPRHAFLPRSENAYAYANRPRPIGWGQTISQPFIVALMTEVLDLTPDDHVLEIGAGSGYQAAVLAQIARRVFSLEVIPELARSARSRLAELGYDNVTVIEGDGYEGLPDKAPFSAIMVTAAPERLPDSLLRQLAPEGRMVIPVGPSHRTQILKRIHRRADSSIESRDLLPVAFVPMVPASTPRVASPRDRNGSSDSSPID